MASAKLQTEYAIKHRARERARYYADVDATREKAKAQYHKHREARLASAKAWHVANKDRVKIAQQRYGKTPAARSSRLKSRFGITLDEYNKLLKFQDGVCAICKTTDHPRNLAVDHCHRTGKVRGLLCVRCNHCVGYALDDPERLRSAATYLENT